jgi:hypothetical protein
VHSSRHRTAISQCKSCAPTHSLRLRYAMPHATRVLTVDRELLTTSHVMNRRPENASTLSSRAPAFLLATALIGGGAFAVFHTDSSASADGKSTPVAEARGGGADDPTTPPPLAENTMGALPPGHPSIAASSNDMSGAPTSTDAPQGQFWVAPPTWKMLPNPSTMRLATYRIPRADGDTQDTDLSVVQAGGTTDANIDRWLGQFDQAGKDTRTVKVVHGMKVTIVEVQGSYLGGGMTADNKPTSNPGWALLAAIVETPGTPTFFKMVGPAKSVVAARPAFGALLASVTSPPAQ